MNQACTGCGLVMSPRYLTGGMCLGCEWELELPPAVSVHRVHHDRYCESCHFPSLTELCPRCDDFVST